MTIAVDLDLVGEVRAALGQASAGPWECGDHWLVATATPATGHCRYCGREDLPLIWEGARADLADRPSLTHVHRTPAAFYPHSVSASVLPGNGQPRSIVSDDFARAEDLALIAGAPGWLDRLCSEVDRLRTENAHNLGGQPRDVHVTELAAQVHRVRQLHQPIDSRADIGRQICAACSSSYPAGATFYPCPTMRALDGRE